MKNLSAVSKMQGPFTKIFWAILFLIISFSDASAQDITFDLLSYKGGYNISCHGASDGQIDATIVGGTAPYTYSWSNGATTQDLTGVPAGSYTLTVTDSTGGTDTKSITVYQPDVVSAVLSPSVFGGGYNINIHGGNNGAISADITGGAPPYTYLWNTGSTISHINALYAGEYSVTITDQNGCTSSESLTLTEPPALHVSYSVSHHGAYNLSCGGGSDGAIDLTVTGGVPPYQYDYGTGERSEDPYLHNTYGGEYWVSVMDMNGAEVDSTIILTQPPGFSVTLSASSFGNGYNTGCYGCFDGSAEIASISGGAHPYTYLWQGGQTTNTITNIGAGGYSVVVTDASGCTSGSSITLTGPPQEGWGRTGNAAAAAEFIGTTNTSPLVFKANGAEGMRLMSDGKVGIGTTTPAAQLDVNGDARVNGTITVNGFSMGDGRDISYIPASGSTPRALGWGVTAAAAAPVLTLPYCLSPISPTVNLFNGMTYSFGNNVNGGYLNVMRSGFDGANGIVDVAGVSDAGDPRLLLNYYCGKDVDICTGTSGNIHLTSSSNGKVGIGTDNPTEKLDVAGNIKLNSNALYLKDDTYHGLKYTTSFAGSTLDGPVLFGYSNGALGTTGGTGNKLSLFWNDAGKVGIGNTDPQAQLDITGDLKVSSLASASATNMVVSNSNGVLGVMPLASAGVGFWSSTDGGDNIFHNTGKVGIGTNAPADLLQVGDGATRLVSGKADGADLNYGTSYIGFNADRNGSTWKFNTDYVHNGGAVIYGNIFGDMYFSTIPNNSGSSDQTKTDAEVLANTKLFISSDGNVAIGTIHPDGFKLSVNGNMRAKDIIVRLTGWSDFVFEENYKRMSILDKETYYRKEKHLPNIDCGNEIVSNGLQVGTTMNGMMQNIEENTLDLADLYKKFLTLEKENQELKQRVAHLENGYH
jgi:hypothetical protein